MTIHFLGRGARIGAGCLVLLAACTNNFDAFGSGATSSSTTTTTTTSSGANGPGGSGTGGVGGATGGGPTSSTTVGGGGAASSSSSSASSGGTGGVGGPEDCLDGVDNDGDGMIDCADSDCQSYECVPSVPGGWEGFVRVHDGAYPVAAPSACPDATSPTSYFGGPVAAQCGACACGGWAGATCGAPPLTCWLNAGNCTGAATDLTAQVSGGNCYNVPGIPGGTPRSCALTGAAPLTQPGSCPPSGGGLTNLNPWSSQYDACVQAPQGGAGCGAGAVCVPKGAGDYAGPACVRASGTQACPAGFPTSIQAFGGGTDNRSCSACGCAVQNATCTGGAYTLYDFDGCNGANVQVSSLACADETGLLDLDSGSFHLTTQAQPSGGTCAPDGGQPSGSVDPTGPVTICCE